MPKQKNFQAFFFTIANTVFNLMAMITLVFINQSSVQTQYIQVYSVIKNFYRKKTLSPTKDTYL